jgi:AraC family transcriptional regulator
MHYAARVGLAAVARQVHASPYHFARIFRGQTGLSLHTYQTRLRLAAALERIAAGTDNLTELALTLGFSSHAHFTGAFVRQFGLTPSGFRRRATNARLREMSTILES